MRKLLKIFSVELFGLYAANQIARGLVFQDQLIGLLITAGALAVATTFVKPIINILILPLTLATVGLLKFLGHTITLYLVDLALEQFKVTEFSFPGLTSSYLDLPPFHYGGGVMAYIAFSILIGAITGIINWLIK